MSERLHNGIVLPAIWPPRDVPLRRGAPQKPPYLLAPPEVISIDVGRQLFVDDFLIDRTDLPRTCHKAQWRPGNPVLEPQSALELNDGRCPVAAPFQDGLFYDSRDRLYKLWYHAGWFDAVGHAVSDDGVHWRRPALAPDGSNRVLPRRQGIFRDGCGVWLDHEAADPAQRFKMFLFVRDKARAAEGETVAIEGGELYTSPDGIHWCGPHRTGLCSDNSNFYYDPFRRKWVFSLKTVTAHFQRYWQSQPHLPPVALPAAEEARRQVLHQRGRSRSYYETADFLAGRHWSPDDVVLWAATDDADLPDAVLGYPTELYNLDAVGYESFMLGVFAIHKGPPNGLCSATGIPKTTDLVLGYSRDGFHWHRPDRTPFLAATRQPGDWNRGYLHAVGGICTVDADTLTFAVGGWSGRSPNLGQHMYAGGSMGLATLRRDGFASLGGLDTAGTLTTRLLRFSGAHLFVNVDNPAGELRVEVLDEQYRPVAPWTADACIPVRADATRHAVRWRGGASLEALAGRPLRLRFHLAGGRLYSFWVSRHQGGASDGFVAAGGPPYADHRDRPPVG